MVRRALVAATIAVAIGLATARPQAATRPSDDGDLDGYNLWSNCSELPDSPEFLPIYLPGDSHGFIDLGRNQTVGVQEFHAMQYTRDKDFGPWLIRTGRWYGGLLFESWPVHTVDPRSFLERLRVTGWEIDGTLYPVDPACVWTQDTDEQSVGLFNAWVRFTTAGTHTLKVFYRQLAQFPYTDPLLTGPGADPFGLDGRRVLVKEEIGDMLDEQFVHSYELVVIKDETVSTNNSPLATNR